MTFEEFFQILRDMPQPQPVFYRLYHDEAGHPLFYTMEDLPGSYIEVDQPTYIRSSLMVRVVDGRLIDIQPRTTTAKLAPADQGQCCDPRDVCVIVPSEKDHTRWTVKEYEQN
jgi:hypothetical protein